MPIYEYHCEACGKDFEEQRGSDIKAEQAIKKIEETTRKLPPPFGVRGDYTPTP